MSFAARGRAPARSRRLLTVGHSYVLRSNRKLAEAIAAASNGTWDVTVAAPSYYEGNPRHGDLRPERLQVERDESVEVVGVPVYLSNRVHVALYGSRLRTLMASGFDAIHCWEEPYVLSGGQMALWAPRDAVLTYFSFQNLSKRYPPPFDLVERYALSRANGWVAAATLVDQALGGRPVYRERPHRVIGVGIDPSVFRRNAAQRRATRAALAWNEHEPLVIGYLGRFTAAKGLPLLMRVLDRLALPWRAIFIGSGDREPDLRAWAARYPDAVRIVGNVKHDQVPAYLNAIDLLCAPSQTTSVWREQFGRMLIEALACGVPVVASDSGEIPHVVGDAGTIVGEADETRWVDAITALLASASRRDVYARRGVERVREHYTWQAIGAKYVDFFESLLRDRG